MKNVSYWMDTAHMRSFDALHGDARYDVVVIGAGLTGITTALLLAKAGVVVAVLEADRVGSGTTGHTTAKITLQHGLKYHTLAQTAAQAYAAANKAGLDMIASLVNQYAIACDFCRVDAYVYAQNGDDMKRLEKEMLAYEALGIDGDIAADTSLPFDVRGALRVADQAQFHPLKYLYALAEALQKSGGTIYEQSKVINVDGAAPCVIYTDGGKVSADSVVFATNYPTSDFRGLFFLKLYQQRSYIISADANRLRVSGMHITAGDPVHSVRIHDGETGGRQLLLGGYGHRTAEEDDTVSGYRKLEAFLHEGFNADMRPAYGWSAQDCVTLDGLPYIGAIGDSAAHMYAATGYAKWGMTNSTAGAMMIADSITNSRMIDKEVRSVFDPARLTVAASAKSFLVHAGHTIKAFTADNMNIPTGSYDDVVIGKGAVMRIGGKAQAVYRDALGKVHAYKAHCTHLKCPLEYNEAEGSFDCSCHGSRFSMDGEVLEGPAKAPLEKIPEV